MGQVLFANTDADLIRAAKDGDGSAFAELVRPHYRAAFRVAYGLLHDVDEAEDAVQESAFKAWRRLGNLREGSGLRPWFLAIVANQCRTVSKSRWWSVLRVDPPEAQVRSVDIAAAVDLRSRLQQDLAQADSALISMQAALSTGDQAGFNAGRVTLRSALAAVNLDTAAI